MRTRVGQCLVASLMFGGLVHHGCSGNEFEARSETDPCDGEECPVNTEGGAGGSRQNPEGGNNGEGGDGAPAGANGGASEPNMPGAGAGGASDGGKGGFAQGGTTDGGTGGAEGGADGTAAGGSAGSHSDDLLVYEPFDYPEGLLDSPTGDNAGGLGFLTAWAGNDTLVFGSDIAFTSGALTLLTEGRSALLPAAKYASTTRMIDVSAIPDDLRDTEGKVGIAGGEIWMSFLAYADEAPVLDTDGQAAEVSLDDTDAPTNNHARRSFGFTWYIDAEGHRKPTWGVGVDGFTGTEKADVAVTTRSLLVLRFEFGTEGARAQTMLWVNPDLSQVPELGVPDAQIGAPPFRFNRVRLHNWRFPLHLDELRLGRTYESVVPVE